MRSDMNMMHGAYDVKTWRFFKHVKEEFGCIQSVGILDHLRKWQLLKKYSEDLVSFLVKPEI
jgi:hypothetical protein